MLTGEHLRRAARRDPDKCALIMGDRRISFAALDDTANRVANALIAGGFGDGARIGVLSPTVADYPAVFYGAARSGAVCLNLSVRLTVDDVAQMYASALVDGLAT